MWWRRQPPPHPPTPRLVVQGKNKLGKQSHSHQNTSEVCVKRQKRLNWPRLSIRIKLNLFRASVWRPGTQERINILEASVRLEVNVGGHGSWFFLFCAFGLKECNVLAPSPDGSEAVCLLAKHVGGSIECGLERHAYKSFSAEETQLQFCFYYLFFILWHP